LKDALAGVAQGKSENTTAAVRTSQQRRNAVLKKMGDTGLEALNATGHCSDEAQTVRSQELDSKQFIRKFAQQAEALRDLTKTGMATFRVAPVTRDASVLHELIQVVTAWGNLTPDVPKAIVLIATAARHG
jgi:hypothetical protein